MVFQDYSVIIFVLCSFALIVAVFLYVGARTLRRNPGNRTAQVFAIFFFTASIALALNLPTPLLADPAWYPLRAMLVLTVLYGICVSLGILLIFTLVLRFSNQVVTDRRKVAIALLFLLVFSGFYCLPGAVTIDLSTGTPRSHYSDALAIYSLIGTQATFALIFWFAIQTARSFSDAGVQRRFWQFILGLACFEVMAVTIPLVNAGWVDQAWLFLEILAIPGALLTYLGVGKQL